MVALHGTPSPPCLHSSPSGLDRVPYLTDTSMQPEEPEASLLLMVIEWPLAFRGDIFSLAALPTGDTVLLHVENPFPSRTIAVCLHHVSARVVCAHVSARVVCLPETPSSHSFVSELRV